MKRTGSAPFASLVERCRLLISWQLGGFGQAIEKRGGANLVDDLGNLLVREHFSQRFDIHRCAANRSMSARHRRDDPLDRNVSSGVTGSLTLHAEYAA